MNSSSFNYGQKKISSTERAINSFANFRSKQKKYVEQHKNDEENGKVEIKEIQDPELPFLSSFDDLIQHINDERITSKEIINLLFCQYIEQYIKYILTKNFFYRFDIIKKKYIIEEKNIFMNAYQIKISLLQLLTKMENLNHSRSTHIKNL